ncbi:hypothetical protein WJX81_000041 [Elliptochloris bilobata]|uniref:Heme oxygenase n=1 Tax=Elliptochloris bilobata TaxID=381761 RepID=A0AAW1RCS4_9CHLO
MAATSRHQHNASNALVSAKLAVILTTRELYGRALIDFWHVHSALEDALKAQRTKCTEVAKLEELLPKCGRSAHFAEDICFFTGQPPEAQGPPRPAVAAYVEHLSTAAQEDPRTLIAHAFTQQMALLAGGQAVSKLVRKQLALPPGRGTAAFHFSEDSRQIAQHYRDTVDALAPGLGEEGVRKVLSEHVRAFELNNHILRTFAVGYWPSLCASVRYIPVKAQIMLASILAAVCALLAARQLHR